MHIFYHESRQLPNTCNLLLTSDQHNNNVLLSALGNNISQEEASRTHRYHMKTGGKKHVQNTLNNKHTHTLVSTCRRYSTSKILFFFPFFLHAYLFEQQQMIFIKSGDLALSVFDDLLWASSQDEPKVHQNGDYSAVLFPNRPTALWFYATLNQ